jgi:hypothetical protein
MAEASVVVAEFTNIVGAQLAQSRLEAEGIPCNLADDHTIAVPWNVMPNRYQLRVAASNQERALAILMNEEGPELDPGWDEPFEKEPYWLCSLCGSVVKEGLETCPDCLTERGAVRAPSPTTAEAPSFPTFPSPRPRPPGPETFTTAPGAPLGTTGPLLADEEVETPDEEAGVQLPEEDDLRLDTQVANRALRYAILGPLGCGILTCYSLFLIYELWLIPGGLTPRSARTAKIALIINLVWCAFLAMLLFSRSSK